MRDSMVRAGGAFSQGYGGGVSARAAEAPQVIATHATALSACASACWLLGFMAPLDSLHRCGKEAVAFDLELHQAGEWQVGGGDQGS